MDETPDLLTVTDLSVGFSARPGEPVVTVVDSVSLGIKPGQILALVGESGCGKTVTASSLLRLLPHPYGQILKGRVEFEGTNLLDLSTRDLYAIRGGKIAMVFQEPMTALNPVQTTGDQISEVLQLHRSEIAPRDRRKAVINLLKEVELPDPEVRVKAYPFQLSGGMRQRVMIAMALAGQPRLLIADEPTTALDVTVQDQVLRLVLKLRQSQGMAVLWITHDMGVVARLADEVAVMYAGQLVEQASARELFETPLHPYTQGLMASTPRLDSIPKTPLPSIGGSVPPPGAWPTGCRFRNRCPRAIDACALQVPEWRTLASGRKVRCIRAGESS